MDRLIFVSHLAATWYMVGLIWFVQLVHYPMMSRAADFVEYELVHQRRTTWAVGPPMLIELATLALLLWLRPPAERPIWIGSGVLLAIVWLSTALIQVPAHQKLGSGFDESVHAWLVNSNWIRTVAWSLRGGLILWLVRLP